MTTATRTRPNGHDTQVHSHDSVETCPLCGSALTGARYREAMARMEREEKERAASLEASLRARLTQQIAAKAQAEVERVRRDVARTAEAQVRKARAEQEAVIAQRVQEAKETMEKRVAEAIAVERAKHYEDRMRLDAQLQDVQRKLQRRTAGELGEEFEVDTFEALREAFPSDDITRVSKGAPGADIIHKVMDSRNTVCGVIVYDCKNHRRWQTKFITKLRQDQLHHEADHAVLTSSAFPSGTNHLHIVDGVIVASPARVVALAQLLRRHILQMRQARLGNASRDAKRDKLYDFMVSDRCSLLLDRIGSLSGDLSDLDAKEENSHRTVWKKRADLLRAVQSAHGEFLSEVDRIVSGQSMDSD